MAEILTEQQLSDSDIFIETDVKLLVDDIYNFNNNKLQKYKSQYPPNHIVHIRGATEVFVTSDIHADYRKFVQILVAGGFIRIPNISNVYDGDNIYNNSIISDCEWIKENCLIIIAGDLVDGKRNNSVVDDTKGCFELLLHMLIFNLRIKGRMKNSNILFTIGNHELETVIANTDMLDDYIHDTALIYFQSKKKRADVLNEFYELNPYIYIVLSTPSLSNEVAILHGGLHDKQGQNFDKDKLQLLQQTINNNGLTHLANLHKSPEESIAAYSKSSNTDGLLWTRFYVIQPIQSCLRPSDYALTVVGHCPTTMFPQLSNILDKTDYIGCDSYKENKLKGCVILNCLEKEKTNFEASGLPRIALVDASISSAFTTSLGRNKDFERDRGIELLHLQHVNRKTSRWFNDISRFEINFKDNKTIDIRPSQTGGSHNYKEKYYIYKAKYLKLKNII